VDEEEADRRYVEEARAEQRVQEAAARGQQAAERVVQQQRRIEEAKEKALVTAKRERIEKQLMVLGACHAVDQVIVQVRSFDDSQFQASVFFTGLASSLRIGEGLLAWWSLQEASIDTKSILFSVIQLRKAIENIIRQLIKPSDREEKLGQDEEEQTISPTWEALVEKSEQLRQHNAEHKAGEPDQQGPWRIDNKQLLYALRAIGTLRMTRYQQMDDPSLMELEITMSLTMIIEGLTALVMGIVEAEFGNGEVLAAVNRTAESISQELGRLLLVVNSARYRLDRPAGHAMATSSQSRWTAAAIPESPAVV